jgi:hypothetical protein
MRLLRALSAAAVAAGIAAGCSDSLGTGGDDPVISDLAGHWEASEAVFTNPANTSQSLDAVSNFGFVLTLDVTNNGRFEGTLKETTLSPTQDISGQITIDESSITITLDDDPHDPWRGSFDLRGDELTINATVGISFDFGSGEVSATLRLVMER